MIILPRSPAHLDHKICLPKCCCYNSQDKLKKTPITLVYNYPKITPTADMLNVLDRGLNFCVTPDKVNITELIFNGVIM